MSDKPNAQESVDLENAVIDGGTEPTKETPNEGAGSEPKKGPQVVAKPLGVTESIPPASDAQVEKTIEEERKRAEEAAAPASKTDDGFSMTPAAERTMGLGDLHINQVCVLKKGDVRKIDALLRSMYPTEKEAKEAAKNPSSFMRIILSAIQDGWGSNSQDSYIEVLQSKSLSGEPVHKKLVSQKEGEFKDAVTHNVHTEGTTLTGEEARDFFMAKITGLKRIKLMNSGFWVTVRRPEITELQDMYDAIDLEAREVGYSIGAHFALVADLYIKKRFVDSLITSGIIRDSNLKGIFKEGVFAEALSIHDYDTLIHGVLSLMSRKGVRVRTVCPECRTVDVVDNIDIDSTKYYNLDLLTPEVNKWWLSVDENGQKIEKRSLKDVQHYQNDILGYQHTFEQSFDGQPIKITLRVPSVAKYCASGEMLINIIRDVINDKGVSDDARRQTILLNMAAHSFQMITPWVASIESDGKSTSDPSVIMSMFDVTTQDSVESDEDALRPFDHLTEFLAQSKITYIGSFAIECPKCHAKPDVGLDQFYPLEPQSIFFGQLFRRLPRELMQQGE